MRVAVNVEQLLYPSPGGIGRYTAQLVSVLASMEPADDVVPFTARHASADVDAALIAAGAPGLAGRAVISVLPRPVLYEGWMSGDGWPPLAWGAPRLRGVDVVHAPSVAVPPRGRVPLVASVHDAAPVLYPETYPANGLRFHRRALRAVARRADLVITGSHAAAEELVTHTDINEARIRVVHHGIAAPNIDAATRAATLQRFDLTGRPYVMWVGSLEPRKDVATVVRAMGELLRRRGERAAEPPGARPALVLGGYPGWLGEALVSAADRAALGPDLRELGRLSEDDLWALYGGAAVFAFPSRHEGFGLPVLEAMSQGAPVLCSDLPVLREVAGDAATYVAVGAVSSWADALESLLAEPAGRQEHAARGRAHAARYSVEAAIAATRAVYREAIGQSRRG